MSHGSDLDRVLGPGGLLDAAAGGYEDRPSQRVLARKVLEALLGGRHLVAEAGTGTGKTLAYLVPAVLARKKVVVSTATRALQEQIFQKDLPLVFDLLGGSFSAACLKGRANYVCLARKARFDTQPLFPFRDDRHLYDKVRRWLQETSTGDIADIFDVPEDWSTWKEIVSSTDTCLGQKCEYSEDCFVNRARTAAAAADIVVVNHHLFFADTALKASPAGALAGAAVIPPYDAAIFDEAHVIEDVATSFFGLSLSNYRIRDLVRDAKKAASYDKESFIALAESAERLLERSDRFFSALRLETNRHQLRQESIDGASSELQALGEAFDLLAAIASRHHEDEDLFAIERRARELQAILGVVVDLGKEDRVHWSDVRGGLVYLHSSPVDAAMELRENLLGRVESLVFTSATLSAGGSLRFFQNRIGLSEENEDLFELDAAILPSPFDFERQAALYVPSSIPEPNDPGFTVAVAEEARKLCRITGGRAFILCTSHRNMEAIHSHLESSPDWLLLKQGEAPKSALLERFREQPSVLVATQSFWEGVDVPGEALSLVIVDKLPFAPPNDPILSARIDALRSSGRSPFNDLQLPQAALALKQGFGRLIRTTRDRGIVAVCDIRLARKGYRRQFLSTLPPCPRFRDIEGLHNWWRTATT